MGFEDEKVASAYRRMASRLIKEREPFHENTGVIVSLPIAWTFPRFGINAHKHFARYGWSERIIIREFSHALYERVQCHPTLLDDVFNTMSEVGDGTMFEAIENGLSRPLFPDRGESIPGPRSNDFSRFSQE